MKEGECRRSGSGDDGRMDGDTGLAKDGLMVRAVGIFGSQDDVDIWVDDVAPFIFQLATNH